MDILERYDKTSEGEYIVSIKADSYKVLFNEFDFPSSFWKRDLREDFVDYLIDCADEIGLKNRFILKILLPESEKDGEIEEKFSIALRHYFYYLIHLSKKDIRKIATKISFNFAISIVLLFLAFFSDKVNGEINSFIYSVLYEGLYIAIWVLMWPVFSDFLFDLKESFNRIRIYKKILKAKIKLEYF